MPKTAIKVLLVNAFFTLQEINTSTQNYNENLNTEYNKLKALKNTKPIIELLKGASKYAQEGIQPSDEYFQQLNQLLNNKNQNQIKEILTQQTDGLKKFFSDFHHNLPEYFNHFMPSVFMQHVLKYEGLKDHELESLSLQYQDVISLPWQRATSRLYMPLNAFLQALNKMETNLSVSTIEEDKLLLEKIQSLKEVLNPLIQDIKNMTDHLNETFESCPRELETLKEQANGQEKTIYSLLENCYKSLDLLRSITAQPESESKKVVLEKYLEQHKKNLKDLQTKLITTKKMMNLKKQTFPDTLIQQLEKFYIIHDLNKINELIPQQTEEMQKTIQDCKHPPTISRRKLLSAGLHKKANVSYYEKENQHLPEPEAADLKQVLRDLKVAKVSYVQNGETGTKTFETEADVKDFFDLITKDSQDKETLRKYLTEYAHQCGFLNDTRFLFHAYFLSAMNKLLNFSPLENKANYCFEVQPDGSILYTETFAINGYTVIKDETTTTSDKPLATVTAKSKIYVENGAIVHKPISIDVDIHHPDANKLFGEKSVIQKILDWFKDKLGLNADTFNKDKDNKPSIRSKL